MTQRSPMRHPLAKPMPTGWGITRPGWTMAPGVQLGTPKSTVLRKNNRRDSGRRPLWWAVLARRKMMTAQVPGIERMSM